MTVRFGDCAFDGETREVLRRGELVHLTPKTFRLLELLLERRPKAVSKEELMGMLWPGTFVAEGNLARLVAELRDAVGDDAHEPRFIRTVHGFGYAFSGGARSEQGGRARPPGVYRLIWKDREIALTFGENLFGRDDTAVVWIDDPAVSRRHARIVVDESGAVLEDLGSKNGTYVRGKKVQTAVRLTDGDLVTIGPASMTLRVFKETTATATAVPE